MSLPLVAPSPSPVNIRGLQARKPSALYTFQQSVDPSLVWLDYERALLSESRTTPLLLYFTPVLTCDDDENENTSDEHQEAKSLIIDQKMCRRHQKVVEAAVEHAAELLSSTQVLVVRIDVNTWPEMLNYHLMSTTPSLLWIPGRASGRFQRYPHVETNLLDLSVNGSLFNDIAAELVAKNEKYDSDAVKEVASRNIAAFVRLCQERCGYLTRNANGQLSSKILMTSSDDAFSVLELVPVLAFLAFIVFVVHENRDFVLRVMQTRLFWFILCLIIMYVALSGLFHSIIHHRSWFYFSQMHGFVFLYPNSRRQFVLEGLINGTWSFWMSMGLMSISDVAPTLNSHLAREEILRWSLTLVVISYMALYFTFYMKYPWLF